MNQKLLLISAKNLTFISNKLRFFSHEKNSVKDKRTLKIEPVRPKKQPGVAPRKTSSPTDHSHRKTEYKENKKLILAD